MVQLRLFLSETAALFSSLFMRPDWRNVLDIAVTSIIIYNLFRLAVRTRASAVFKGIALVFVLAWLAEAFQLSALNWVLRQVINTGVICLVVLFQPELRKALEQLGRSNLARRMLTPTSRKLQHSDDTEKHIQEIINAAQSMSRKRIGALIVFEGKTGLKDIIATGTICDAAISSALIQNIFEPNTPLHDGATIIKHERIVASACFLQLSENDSISRDLGTRHRAAIGITESTDAISLIVSEETGIISYARGGKLTRYVDENGLHALLTEIFENDYSASDLFSDLRNRFTKRGESDA
ncbi:MAG: diadenylate cyclase CdaA [Clostridia bacterium]|nr:diadenylate cyclase CdaA [Clostridia bacterium]